MSRRASSSSNRLEPPRKSVELEDRGAHDLSSEEDYFSDASEGRRKPSRPVTPASPIPTTRVEKVDDDPRHGEIPGTEAYSKRKQDAVPDEIEVVPEGSNSRRGSRQFLGPPLSPGGTPIPKTVVQKVDPASPSYGDIPGTEAYRQRLADAPPDLILGDADASKAPRFSEEGSRPRAATGASIPETIITKVDDEQAFGEVPGTAAAQKRKLDAMPDKVELEDEAESDDPQDRRHVKPRSNSDGDAAGELEDNFDDFEEGDEADADDDFGDFDDFEEGEDDVEQRDTPTEVERPARPTYPLIDFETLADLPDLIEATQAHLEAMFPSTLLSRSESSPPEPLSSDPSIFPSERSRSLWKQLITPPPLQAPNWTQSRIRRLFLINLGVPVDLDEILPPSKQKKLILPDINLPTKSVDGRPSTDKGQHDSIAKLKGSKANDSTASIDSQQSGSKSARGRNRPQNTAAKQPPAPPALDLTAVRRICATTDEKLEGFTDDELKSHINELEVLTEKTSQTLEYWLKKRDGLRKEKEAFEGVIENLVRHAKRVRTTK